MTKKTELFRHIKGEEALNDFFVSFLSWSLEEDPIVLNAIHDNLNFSEDAEIIATQRQGLPRSSSETESTYILDWVISDHDKLVGYESKTDGSVPTSRQLNGELEKLKANQGGRDSWLFAITDHSQQPSSVEQTDANWLSWYHIAERVLDIDTNDKSIQLLQSMFEYKDYDGFSGFSEFERDSHWLTKHDTEFIELAFDVDRHLDDIHIYTEGNTNLWHSTSKNLQKLKQKSYSTINQAYLSIPYHPEGSHHCVENHYRLSIFLPALENDLRVYMDINANQGDHLDEFVRNNAETFTEIIREHDMNLLTSYNSLNTPHNELLKYNNPDEVKQVLSEYAGQDNWKRLQFGWHVPTNQSARTIVIETAERLQQLRNLFYKENKYFSADDLPV